MHPGSPPTEKIIVYHKVAPIKLSRFDNQNKVYAELTEVMTGAKNE